MLANGASLIIRSSGLMSSTDLFAGGMYIPENRMKGIGSAWQAAMMFEKGNPNRIALRGDLNCLSIRLTKKSSVSEFSRRYRRAARLEKPSN